MTTFTGTSGGDVITPELISDGVTTDGDPTPGAGRDFFDGLAGDDTLAAGSDDVLSGGEGDDVLISADGAILSGDEGNDILQGAELDVLFGGDGNDVMKVGFSTRAFGEAGDDTVVAGVDNNGAQISGGEGDDVFFGISGNLVFFGEDGDDTMFWNMSVDQFSDTLLDGGDGIDTFTIFTPQDGDGSEISLSNVEGFNDVRVRHGGGTDAQLFTQAVEHIVVQASAAADEVEIEDLSGLGVEKVDLHLGGLEDAAPDGQGDTLLLNATADADVVTVSTALGRVVVNGLPETVAVDQIDSADRLTVNAGDGDDLVDLAGAKDASLQSLIVVDGGDGVDAIRGSALADDLNGGAGDDSLTGRGGADALAGGAGDDRFAWNLGDGVDTVAGGEGADQQGVTTGAAGEAVRISASADHATVSVDGAAILDLDSVETLSVSTLQGGDSVTIDDLAGSALRAINVDLAVVGQADASTDRVTVNGAAVADRITLVRAPGGDTLQVVDNTDASVVTTVAGLDSRDQLSVAGGAGDDLVIVKGVDSLAQITVQGGEGNDEILGGVGHLTLNGGAGADTIQAGEGANIVGGDEGDDVLISATGAIVLGGSGDDVLEASSLDVLIGGDGADQISLGSSTRADGGTGNDLFLAGDGTSSGSQSNGGDGDDVFAGVSGNLTFHGDLGDDKAFWLMREAQFDNTLIDGGSGFDSFTVATPEDAIAWSITLGANTPGSQFELIDLQRQGREAKLFTQSVESLSVRAGQGADTIRVFDQTGLGVQKISIDLGASPNGGGDGQIDSLTLNATADADHVTVAAAGGDLTVAGLPETVVVQNVDSGAVSDHILVAAGAGDDLIDFSGLSSLAGVVTVDGGSGDDTVAGGDAGIIVAFSGAGHDVVTGFDSGADHLKVGSSLDVLTAAGHITQVGDDVVITVDAGTLTLTGVTLGSLQASDFLLG